MTLFKGFSEHFGLIPKLYLEDEELDLDKSAVEEMYKQYDFNIETTDADIQAFQNVADFMLKTEMIENEVNVEDLFIK